MHRKPGIPDYRWFFPVLLVAIVCAALPLFHPSAEFTGDDYYYVANNPLVTAPGFSSLVEIWKRPMKIEYFPVTISSYAVEYKLWGGSVRLYHVTQLLIFACIGFVTRSLAIRLVQACSGG